MSARLVFRGLRRVFRNGRNSSVAIAEIDLTLEPGSFTAVVGPSGSGKATLLHIAAGLDTQYEGKFTREPENATLACLFQQPRLLPWRSARDNVAFVLEARRRFPERNRAGAPAVSWPWSASQKRAENFLRNYRAECSSASHSRGRLRLTRICSSWTNRFPRSMS